MIDLKKIWSRQREFQYNFYNPDNVSEEQKILLTKEYILSMHRELGEVLNVIPWKLHRANSKDYDVAHLQEELIDCFKYLLNVCIVHGMTPESFEQIFLNKSDIVEKRWHDEMSQKPVQLELPFNQK
jgi:dimeric dUTPase (all-alpha-NTP-PPase superfamily)